MKILFAILFFSFITLSIKAQPFADEIRNFKKEDSLHFPPGQSILFIGSSSFRKWVDVQSYFPAYPIINRGFGGSTLPNLIHYADDIIFPYKPRQVVIYCGENDFASSDTVTANIVFNRFRQLFELIRSEMKDENIVFVSIKPSPSRKRLWPKMQEANNLVKTYIAQQKKASFVDVYKLMFDKEGIIRQDIFLEDNLHMNSAGYAIWQKAIQPYLIK